MTNIKMRDYVSDFPKDIRLHYYKIYKNGCKAFLDGDFASQEQMMKSLYQEIRNNEDKQHIGRYHKGNPLYELGASIFLQGKTDRIPDAYRYIFLAYIEDLIDFASDADVREADAYHRLSTAKQANGNLFSQDLLDVFKKEVDHLREIRKLPNDPQKIFDLESDAEKAIKRVNTELPPKETAMEILGYLNGCPRKNRVFVGGNYLNIALLRQIQKIVENLGFRAIIPANFVFGSRSYDEYIHEMSLQLLKKCNYAIFEVSIGNGHMMEIERARDHKKAKILLIYQVNKKGDKPKISDMLSTIKEPHFLMDEYTDLSELECVISKMLPKK